MYVLCYRGPLAGLQYCHSVLISWTLVTVRSHLQTNVIYSSCSIAYGTSNGDARQIVTGRGANELWCPSFLVCSTSYVATENVKVKCSREVLKRFVFCVLGPIVISSSSKINYLLKRRISFVLTSIRSFK
jgi:hypothetical protein